MVPTPYFTTTATYSEVELCLLTLSSGVIWYNRRTAPTRTANELRNMDVDGSVRCISVEEWLSGQPRNAEGYVREIWYVFLSCLVLPCRPSWSGFGPGLGLTWRWLGLALGLHVYPVLCCGVRWLTRMHQQSDLSFFVSYGCRRWGGGSSGKGVQC